MTITSSDLDDGGRAAPARFPGSFLDNEDKQPFQALNLEKSSADGVLDGSLKMLVLSKSIENSSTKPFFVMSDGQITGAVKLGHSFEMTSDDYDFMQKLHGLPEGAGSGSTYGYRVSSYEPFEDTVKIAKSEGVVINVEDYLPSNIIKMVPIRKNLEDRIVASAVLVPGVTDLHEEIYDEETVRAAAYYFLEHMYEDDDHGMDVMHDGEVVRNSIRPVQSFVLDEERTYTVDVPALDDEEHPSKSTETITLPKGTWILYARIISDTLWSKVKSGDYTGWSIAGLARVRELRKILSMAA